MPDGSFLARARARLGDRAPKPPAPAPVTEPVRPAPIPMPPLEMRALVGPTTDEAFDNPTGELVFGDAIPANAYRSVLDFGCGCGRLARKLIQQQPRPERYLGLDLHPGMVRWDQENLTPVVPSFRFEHHDVDYPLFNPGPDKPMQAPFPMEDGEASLVIAFSVYTHLLEAQARHYLAETARVLSPDGWAYATWFLFDKQSFPMMQDFQNALFINENDPRNAVIYDRTWLLGALDDVGLALAHARPPDLRGHQWFLSLVPAGSPSAGAELPDTDDAPFGLARAAASVADAHRIGLDDEAPPVS